MNIGFIVKGKTFLRSIGTLIKFSNRAGIYPIIFAYKNREGKSYDSLTQDVLYRVTHDINCQIVWVNSDKDILAFEKKCLAFVGQDMHWHSKSLIGNVPTYSIAMFFDTLHFATTHKEFTFPEKTYFADEWFHKKVNSITGKEWPGIAIGSPSYDHSLFVTQDEELKKKSILFLTPPLSSLEQEQINKINELIDYCFKHKILFFLKDREKTPWSVSDQTKFSLVRDEYAFPYSSMSLLMNSSVHITAYGTSVMESNFLGLPAINLNVKKSSSGRNYDLVEYGVEHYFNNGLCAHETENLIDDYHLALKRKREQERILTFDKNYSLDILSDIINTVS